MLQRTKLRIGRRGAFLTLFAAIYALIGYSFLVAPKTPAIRQNLHFALDIMSLQSWGVLWLTGAAVMLVSATARTGRDYLGFTFAMLLPATLAVLFLMGWLHGDLPRGWVSAALYAALAAAVAVVAGWPEPGSRR